MVDDEVGVHLGDEPEFVFAQFGDVGEDEVCWMEWRGGVRRSLLKMGRISAGGGEEGGTWPCLSRFADYDPDMLWAFFHFAGEIKGGGY